MGFDRRGDGPFDGRSVADVECPGGGVASRRIMWSSSSPHIALSSQLPLAVIPGGGVIASGFSDGWLPRSTAWSRR